MRIVTRDGGGVLLRAGHGVDRADVGLMTLAGEGDTLVPGRAEVLAQFLPSGLIQIALDPARSTPGLAQAMVRGDRRWIRVGAAPVEVAIAERADRAQLRLQAAPLLGEAVGRWGPVFVLDIGTVGETRFLSAPQLAFSPSPIPGADVELIEATWIGAAESITVMVLRSVSTGAETEVAVWSVVPQVGEDLDVRAVTRIQRPDGAWLEAASATVRIAPSETPADVVVSSSAQALAAIEAAPWDLARTYIIGLAPGFYDGLTFPANFNRGSTRVELRGQDPDDLPLFSGVALPHSRNVTLNRIDITHTTDDEFGYPSSGGIGSYALDVEDSVGFVARNVDIYRVRMGCTAVRARQALFERTSFRGVVIDGLRLYAPAGELVEDVTVRGCLFTARTRTGDYPDISADLHAGYTLGTDAAIDPRRSDQAGYAGTTLVTNLAGVQVSVTQGVKDGRHPDFIQTNGNTRNLIVEDCDFIAYNGYAQGVFLKNAYGADLSTGCVVRRCRFTMAHNHALFWGRHDDTGLVEDCLFRQLSAINWAIGLPGGDKPGLMSVGVSTLEADGVITMRNTVLPTDYSTLWYDPDHVAATAVVFSNTAVPVG